MLIFHTKPTHRIGKSQNANKNRTLPGWPYDLDCENDPIGMWTKTSLEIVISRMQKGILPILTGIILASCSNEMLSLLQVQLRLNLMAAWIFVINAYYFAQAFYTGRFRLIAAIGMITLIQLNWTWKMTEGQITWVLPALAVLVLTSVTATGMALRFAVAWKTLMGLAAFHVTLMVLKLLS